MPILIEVREKSTQSFTAVVKDDTNTAVVPIAATYTLTTRDGTVINGAGGVDVENLTITPSVLMTVTLAGADLKILDQTKKREYRLLTIKTDRGDITEPETLQEAFWIKNLKVIT